jgi:hypothetical protein
MERRANPQSSALPPIAQPRSAFGPARGVVALACLFARSGGDALYSVGRNGEAVAEMVANSLRTRTKHSFRGAGSASTGAYTAGYNGTYDRDRTVANNSAFLFSLRTKKVCFSLPTKEVFASNRNVN